MQGIGQHIRAKPPFGTSVSYLEPINTADIKYEKFNPKRLLNVLRPTI